MVYMSSGVEWPDRPTAPAAPGLIAGQEVPVNDLVVQTGMAQPLVSKHLRVLRAVGAVSVRDEGRQRLYRLNGEALKPIHDWLMNVEAVWAERLDRLGVVVGELADQQRSSDEQKGMR